MPPELSINQCMMTTVSALILFWGLVAGAVMLISPSRWAKLPTWMSFRGTVSPSFTKTLIGRIQVRILGLFVSVCALFMLAALFGHPIIAPNAGGFVLDEQYVRFRVSICLLTCSAVLVCGIIMLFNPRWWIQRFFVRPSEGRVAADTPGAKIAVRLCSLPLIGVAVYLGVQCIIQH